PVGSVVPSERQICEQFGVSHITARRALLELQRRGLIYRQAGIGTFVAGPQRRTRLTLVFAGFDADRWQSTAGVMGDLVGGITEVAWRRHCGLDIERLDTGLDAGDLSRLLVERETDGLLLRLAGDATPAHIALLEETRVPFVLILTCIRTSHYETGKVAAEAVIELILSPEQHAQQLVIEPVLEVQASCGAASTDRCISSQS
ncbi:MAG: GntR family transcriptional regulator, partial [Chloroflexota bacterium]|nr:GntR family transcriptional regulator [Chloroflexota bacterium]